MFFGHPSPSFWFYVLLIYLCIYVFIYLYVYLFIFTFFFSFFLISIFRLTLYSVNFRISKYYTFSVYFHWRFQLRTQKQYQAYYVTCSPASTPARRSRRKRPLVQSLNVSNRSRGFARAGQVRLRGGEEEEEEEEGRVPWSVSTSRKKETWCADTTAGQPHAELIFPPFFKKVFVTTQQERTRCKYSLI